MSEQSDKLENFERAFDCNVSSCRGTCNCGQRFFDYENTYDWEPGELEKLKALETHGKATGVPYGIGFVRFEGKEYVNSCDCWHKRAEQIIGFIDGHARRIAKYLTLEKKRLQSIADEAPVVEEPK